MTAGRDARAIGALVILVTAGWRFGVSLPPDPAVLAQEARPSTPALQVLKLRPNVHVIVGAGTHVTVQSGDDGLIVVNSGGAAATPALLTAIKQISNQPIRYVINTNGDPDSVGGNEALARAGAWFGARGGGLGALTGNAGGAAIVSTESVALRMAIARNGESAYPAAAWPTETFTGRSKPLRLNGDGIQIIPFAKAQSEEDLIVLFRNSDVVVLGNLIDMSRFPQIDVARGGTIGGLLAALNAVKDMVIPQLPLAWKDGGTLVVPAHGRIIEKDDVVQYRDMVTIVRDVVKQMKDQGMSVDAVVSKEPAMGYSARYGIQPGSTEAFLRAIYDTLEAKP